MHVNNQIFKLISVGILIASLTACKGESNSSSTVNSDSTSMNSVVPDTTSTRTEVAPATPANGPYADTAMNNASRNASENPSRGHSRSHITHTANRETIRTEGQVGPHATTVLRGEKSGEMPKGNEKGKIPEDTVLDSRHGLAPAK